MHGPLNVRFVIYTVVILIVHILVVIKTIKMQGTCIKIIGKYFLCILYN